MRLLEETERPNVLAGTPEMWHSNIKANVAAVNDRIEWPETARIENAIIACYGPSLADTFPLIAMAQARGAVVITTSGAHDFLIERGIVPDYHVEVDPRPHKAAMLTPDPRVEYLIASMASPEVIAKIKAVGASVRLWHSAVDEIPVETLHDLVPDPDPLMVGGGSTVGLRACSLMYGLGFRDIEVHGMDCSYADDGTTHAGMHTGKPQERIAIICGGQSFQSSWQLVAAARDFATMVVRIDGVTWRLAGDGLLQFMCRPENRVPDPIAEAVRSYPYTLIESAA
jgi:uncharacterized Rossmann fold enzyme